MRRMFLGLILAGLLAACGSKGPLYHPDDKPAPKPAAKAAASPPTTKSPSQ